MRPIECLTCFILCNLFHHAPCAILAENTIGDIQSDGTEVEQQRLPFYDLSTCTVKVDVDDDQVIDLSTLARDDGTARFTTTYNTSSDSGVDIMYFSYNPCVPFTFQPESFFGRLQYCNNVTMCKYAPYSGSWHLFTLGIPSPDSVHASYIEDKAKIVNYSEDSTELRVALVYSVELMKNRNTITVVELVCDPSLSSPQDAVFTVIKDAHTSVTAELRHKCCCPGACYVEPDDPARNEPNEKNGYMVTLVGAVAAVVLVVICIGCGCWVKGTHHQFYSKLPGIVPNPDTSGAVKPHRPQGGSINGKSAPQHATSHWLNGHTAEAGADLRDYEPSALVTARRKLIPVLTDPKITAADVEMGQRLGGGVFMDTHLGKWKELSVTVKRLTLSIHNNQLSSEVMDLMKEEVWALSRQRHKNIVCVFGLSLDGRLPFLLTEYVVGECLKDFLKGQGRGLIWPQRVRLCCQIADGMTFLHSIKQPIIHRDLRCGNIFLSDQDYTVKVADFGLTKMLQPLREQCTSSSTEQCGCQKQMAACPPSIRWTAPELLSHPTTREGDSSCISTSCDVYSFSMVMLEMWACKDPFHNVSSEIEVIEIVKNSGRPEIPITPDVLPQYRDLMKMCWDQRPSFRPAFKQVASKLKEMVSAARTHQKHLNNRQRHPNKSPMGSREIV